MQAIVICVVGQGGPVSALKSLVCHCNRLKQTHTHIGSNDGWVDPTLVDRPLQQKTVGLKTSNPYRGHGPTQKTYI